MKDTSKLSEWCDKLLEICWLLALILSPLFFNIHSDRVFEPDKITLVRSLASLMVAIWLVRFINERGWEEISWLKWSTKGSIWKIPFVLPVAVIALIYIISSLFSVTPSVSWLGSYQRLQGTYTTLSYMVIFAVMAATIRSQAQVRRVITAVIMTSIPIALYGMLQRFGLDPLPWGGDVQNRIAGHMGNAIFIAAYLIMAVPVTLARIISAFTSILSDEELNVADIIRSSIYIFALAIQLIAIYWSGSRGPLLGLLIGVFAFISIFLVALRNSVADQKGYSGKEILSATFGLIAGLVGFILAVVLRPSIGDAASLTLFLTLVGLSVLAVFVLIALRVGWKWLWLSWLLIAFVGGAWIVAFNLSGDMAQTAPDNAAVQTLNAWRQLPGIGRYGRLLESESSTGKVRVLIWEGVMDLITPHEPLEFPDGTRDSFNFLRPLIGYGPESMYVAYNRFYPPELATVEARNASPDRSHNETWDSIVITGLLGFLAWQWLYLSIFYYGFKWMGVVSSKRDRNILIGLWIVGGLIMAAAFTVWQGVEFIGVALPFGSIIGMILYLIYYALVARPDKETAVLDPFRSDRLMTIALIGALIAFFVEIHFGIAIVSTRVHSFVYIALMLAMGYLLPQTIQEPIPTAAVVSADTTRLSGRKRRGRTIRRTSSTLPEWLQAPLLWSFLLGIIIATLSFNYTAFTPPPNLEITSPADIPTAGDIFYQSFFINPSNQFADSPFLFLLLAMTWILGTLVAVSEMIRSGLLELPNAIEGRNTRESRLAGILLVALGVAALVLVAGSWIGLDAAVWTPTQRIGRLTVAPLIALLSFYAGMPLLTKRRNSALTASAIALSFLGLALLIWVAGAGLYGLGLFAVGVIVLYLLWSAEVGRLVWPAATVAFGSLGIGLLYAFIHASRIRRSLIIPAGVTAETAEPLRRLAEAQQFAGILTTFYVFLFLFVLLFAWLAVAPKLPQINAFGTMAGFIALLVIIPLVFLFIGASNLQVIQADMIYKRGKPFDNQASSIATQNPETGLVYWDNAIAVYQEALRLTPREDFYYLWLGRAYLEKSSLLNNDLNERDEILQTAENSLFVAQDINPLNTDHTANLARLNTRWASVVADEEREFRIGEAERHYDDAIALSPQNAVIRNEEARMIYSFYQDCEQSIDLYEESAAIDPFYYRTRFELAEIYLVCARQAAEDDRPAMYDTVIDLLQEGTQLALEKPGRERTQASAAVPRGWLQAYQFFIEAQAPDHALAALEQLKLNPGDVEAWQFDFYTANAYSIRGDIEQALALARQSLQSAPPEAAPQIQQFIDSLAAVETSQP